MIAIGSDHGGYDLKLAVIDHLEERGLLYRDYGCFDKKSCDYPDFGRAVAMAVKGGECERGILICTTGIGISITANRIAGIRCALCTDPFLAKMTREHNDANILALGGGIVGVNLALAIIDTFLDTPFSAEGKHQRRVDGIELWGEQGREFISQEP
ncbi:MAG: ribose 5-phosphate isomerase B [Lachnospiraceae bacterium]|nr:ribose 5-phosphate isomerase B [Lachnospiraceae bacterium]